MTDWEETLQTLRDQFLRGSVARFEQIESSLARLSTHPSDPKALADLRLVFHGFSGLGGSYGYPRVTLLGQDGERQCDALSVEGKVPGEAELAALRGLLDEIRSDLCVRPVAPVSVPALDPPLRGEGLVVEADPALRAELASVVEGTGLSALCAASRAEALAALETRTPAAALVGAQLPDGSGHALVERIRGMAGGEGIAIFIIAGRADLLDRVEAIHCRADGLLERPLDAQVLGRRLEQRLARGPAGSPRVLAVGDDPDHAGFVRAILESAGYEVCVAAGAPEFEEALSVFHPELVLMDRLLPGGVSGYELARTLRQDGRHSALPVLFLTTPQQMYVGVEPAREGGDDHLATPIAPGLLLSNVAARLERARVLKDLVEGFSQLQETVQGVAREGAASLE